MRILLASAAVAALALAACEAEDTAELDMAEDEVMETEEAPAMDDADMADAMEEEEVETAYMVPVGTPDHIRRAVESSERGDEAMARDAGRMPAEVLAMSEIEEGDTIIEFAGFGQYYTTMLAEAVGPEGHVHVFDLPYTDRFAGEPSRAFAEAHDNVTYNQGEYDEMTLPADADAAFIVLYYHDLHVSTNDVDIPAFNQAVYDALKPGGVYLIIDHNAAAGTPLETVDTAHRIDPAVIEEEVLAAGFELAESSDMLANPDDDYSLGPFDPGIRGATDRALFKFVKP